MNHKPIQRVLVTRPAHQQLHLCRDLEALGLIPLSLPCLEIVPLDGIMNPTPGSTALFTSLNAVEHAHRLHALPWLDVRVYAIGQATANALQTHAQTVQPIHWTDSTEWWDWMQARPPLPDALLWISGAGGRRHVLDAMRQKGIDVTAVDTYARQRPHYDDNTLAAVLDTPGPDLLLCSSDAVLENLLHLAGSERQQHLFRTPLIVNSERSAAMAYRKGFNQQILVANPPGDSGQLRCVRSLLNAD